MIRRKTVVKRILNEAYCHLAPSKIHGVGVFAARPIAKGIDPFLDGQPDSNNWVEILPDEYKAAQPGVRAIIKNLFVPTGDRVLVPVTGTNLISIGSYLNHSESPNMETEDGNGFYASRRIATGEELTVDYRTFGAEGLLR